MGDGMGSGSITAGVLSEADWADLLERINAGNCTPFIGPGARLDLEDKDWADLLGRLKQYGSGPLALPGGRPRFPDTHKIARAWADEYAYPLRDRGDLPKVARFVSVEKTPAVPKEKIAKLHKGISPPDFGTPESRDDPHRILASLPFPIYITTNQDAYMWQALGSRAAKKPERELCRWNEAMTDLPPAVFDQGRNPLYEPAAATPLVFHLYGHTQHLESLVVTDDDYMEFLIKVSKETGTIPSRIERAMTRNSLLLLGYRLDDWDFRVLFHILIGYLAKSMGQTHVAVQLTPDENESERDLEERVQKHLEVYRAYVGKYLQSKSGRSTIRVVPQTCQEFVTELRDRWRKSPYAD
jgi:SIR2-like domain